MSEHESSALQRVIRQALDAVVPHRLFIGVSGGLDSACLLHLASRQCPPAVAVRAVHVNHQLHEDADALQQACQALCDALSVPLDVMTVDVDRSSGLGMEAAAREARYRAFDEVMGGGDVLWLAHHQNDQAETILLRLLRGSGVDGLGAMAEKRDAAGGFRVERPLLSVSRAQLEAYACHHQLYFHDDPTNVDTSLDRNYLRHQVMPLLMARWPQAAGAMASSASQAREASALMTDWSAIFFETIMPVPGVLDIDGLREQTPAARRVLIRTALAQVKLPMPPRARLESLLSQLDAAGDALPQVVWPGVEARCWRGKLYLEAPVTPLPPDWCVEWTSGVTLDTPLGQWHGEIRPVAGGSVPQGQATARQGGEQLYLRGHHRRLKTLLQEAGVPPWQRSQCVVLSIELRPVALIFPPHSDRAPWVADDWRLEAVGWLSALSPQA